MRAPLIPRGEMTFNQLVRYLCALGLTPDEAESIVRRDFRHGLKVLNDMRAYDRGRKKIREEVMETG